MVAVESGTGANFSLGLGAPGRPPGRPPGLLPEREGAVRLPPRLFEGFALPSLRPALPLRAPPRRPWSGLCFMVAQRYGQPRLAQGTPPFLCGASSDSDVPGARHVVQQRRLIRPQHHQPEAKPMLVPRPSLGVHEGMRGTDKPALLARTGPPMCGVKGRLCAPGAGLHFVKDHEVSQR